MGTQSGDAQPKADMAERLVDELAPLGDVSARAMFGGFGVFESGVMFVLIDREGTPHLRADDSTELRYVDAGSTKHGMPYWTIPPDVLADQQQLLAWAGEALEVSRAAKRR